MKFLSKTEQVDSIPDHKAVSVENLPSSGKRQSRATGGGLDELKAPSTAPSRMNQTESHGSDFDKFPDSRYFYCRRFPLTFGIFSAQG